MLYPRMLHDFLTQSAQQRPDKTAILCEDAALTYNELDHLTDNLAHSLVHNGLKRQDRVIVFLENSNETVVSLYGIAKAGGIFIILNGSLKPGKLSYIIDNADATMLITHTSKATLVQQAINTSTQTPKTIWIGEQTPDFAVNALSWQDQIAGQYNNQTPLPRGIDLDLAALIYTSGSTGDPKGVMSSHQNMVSAARSIAEYLDNIPEDIILCVLPLSFDYGLYQVLMSIIFGGTIVIEKNFTYIHRTLQKIPEYKITGFPIVPTIVARLLNMRNLDNYDFSSLRYITNTGAALPVEHIRRFRALFPDITIYSMFGLTECKRVGYLPPEQIDIRPGSVGKAMPCCETLILDEQGHPVPPGDIGELVIRGSNVMLGYWKAPELTAKTYRPGSLPGERLLYTGDYFKCDEEGFLYFLGRKDDMIKTRGERVSPKEIENTLSEMPGVAEVAVIGVPDGDLGQVPYAFIVPDRQNTITEQDIKRYCAQSMENFMVPKYITLIESLPKTANGKIDKKSLKRQETDS